MPDIYKRSCKYYPEEFSLMGGCKALKAGSTCTNCKFFKDKEDPRNNALTEIHEKWNDFYRGNTLVKQRA
jgi:hypothetical protein